MKASQSVQVLGGIAGVVSLTTFLTIGLFLPILLHELDSIRSELDSDMGLFRVPAFFQP